MYISSSPFFYCKSKFIIEIILQELYVLKNYITKGKADLADGEERAGC